MVKMDILRRERRTCRLQQWRQAEWMYGPNLSSFQRYKEPVVSQRGCTDMGAVCLPQWLHQWAE